MTTPKRMALAFGCMLLAIAALGILLTVPAAIRLGPRYALPALEILPVYLMFAIPGWVLALPFVVLFKDADGWRAWAILTIGPAIGPAFVLTWILMSARGHIKWQGDGSAFFLSAIISFLTSGFYVLLLRLAGRKQD